ILPALFSNPFPRKEIPFVKAGPAIAPRRCRNNWNCAEAFSIIIYAGIIDGSMASGGISVLVAAGMTAVSVAGIATEGMPDKNAINNMIYSGYFIRSFRVVVDTLFTGILRWSVDKRDEDNFVKHKK